MRYDSRNQFVLEMLFNKYIEVYDYDTWRPYCHIKDFARLIIKVLIQNIVDRLSSIQCWKYKNNFNKKKIAEKSKIFGVK